MKTAKKKNLERIYKMMRKNGLSLSDLEHYIAWRSDRHSKQRLDDDFDLLCLVDGKKTRVPFSLRYLGEPLAIFPFKNEPEYIELVELDNKKHTDKDVDKDRLLDERFCDRVSKVVTRLNVYLKELGKPILDVEAAYLADSTYMQGCGWIIGFDGSADYYGGNSPAKLRYMGRFSEPVISK